MKGADGIPAPPTTFSWRAIRPPMAASAQPRRMRLRTGHAFLNDIAHNAVPVFNALGNSCPTRTTSPAIPCRSARQRNTCVRRRAARRALHRRRRPRQREHRPHRGPPRVPRRAQPAGRAHQGRSCSPRQPWRSPVSFLNEWLLQPVAAVPTDLATLVWNGERLFQAAKFGTEMQYQHLVFEEFARTIQPKVDVVLRPGRCSTATSTPPSSPNSRHVVYRFGHSMLTRDGRPLRPGLQRLGNDPESRPADRPDRGVPQSARLRCERPADARSQAAGAIVRGMTRQVGNEIDEFVTEALRNNLLGLPLDLATINLARGRDTGVPSLNAARKEFYEATGDSQLSSPIRAGPTSRAPQARSR